MAKEFTEKEKQYIIWSVRERLMLKDFWKQQAAARKEFIIESTSKAEAKAKYDAIIVSADTRYLVECKIRNIPSTQYPSSKIMKHKYDYPVNSCNAAAQEGEVMQPLYMVFYQNNKVGIFPLYEIKPEWKVRYGHINSTTKTGNPIIPQFEYNIPNTQACWYDFTIEKDYNALACEVAEALFVNNEFEINRLLE